MNSSPLHRSILVVEDNPVDITFMTAALKKCPLTDFTIVKSGTEALDYMYCRGAFADRVPTLPTTILLDLYLPEMNGIEFLAELRKNPEFKDVPVIVLTGSQEETDIVNSHSLNVESYILKPISFSVLLGALDSVPTVNDPVDGAVEA